MGTEPGWPFSHPLYGIFRFRNTKSAPPLKYSFSLSLLVSHVFWFYAVKCTFDTFFSSHSLVSLRVTIGVWLNCRMVADIGWCDRYSLGWFFVSVNCFIWSWSSLWSLLLIFQFFLSKTTNRKYNAHEVLTNYALVPLGSPRWCSSYWEPRGWIASESHPCPTERTTMVRDSGVSWRKRENGSCLRTAACCNCLRSICNMHNSMLRSTIATTFETTV